MSSTAIKPTNGVQKELAKIPTLQELLTPTETDFKENALMVILNQEPPKQWLDTHPIIKIKDAAGQSVPYQYLPIQRVEYMLSRIYGKWWVEVKDSRVLANSVTVTVRLYVRNPITGETEWNDGIGACAIQTDKDKGAMDWNFAKSDGVMKAAPAAETYAVKDAAEKFGKIFGKDISRKFQISYNDLLKMNNSPKIEDLQELFELKKDALNKKDLTSIERIINNKEVNSYGKAMDILKNK